MRVIYMNYFDELKRLLDASRFAYKATQKAQADGNEIKRLYWTRRLFVFIQQMERTIELLNVMEMDDDEGVIQEADAFLHALID